jgi:excisionase family DNA binding protein
MQTQLLTAKEVAERLNVSHAQVTRYVKSGQLPATRFGNAIVIRAADLRNFKRPAMGPKKKDKMS